MDVPERSDPAARRDTAAAGRKGEADWEEPGLVITRTFDAPRELVFRAWTQPEHFKHWYGPKGFTVPHCTIDLRPGGVMHYCMRSPDGRELWNKGVFREIDPPERLVVTLSLADAAGNVVPASFYGMTTQWPLETLLTVTFAEHEGKTTLTLHHSVPAGVPETAGAYRGWSAALDSLAEYLVARR